MVGQLIQSKYLRINQRSYTLKLLSFLPTFAVLVEGKAKVRTFDRAQWMWQKLVDESVHIMMTNYISKLKGLFIKMPSDIIWLLQVGS